MLEGKKVKHYKAPTFMNVTYGSTTKAKRKTLNLEKTHYKDAIARKVRKSPNISQKRNSKNTKQIEDKKFGFFCLNDKVRIFGRIGFISGFSGKSVYIKDTENNYITMPNKNYKQVSLKYVERLNHNNNWQFISHLILRDLRKETSC